MAKLSREQREALAEKRLFSVLGQHTVCNQRTLEQKISDAGPSGQRIDPHVLTPVRNRLVAAGVIGVTNAQNAPGITPPTRRSRRARYALKNCLADVFPSLGDTDMVSGTQIRPHPKSRTEVLFTLTGLEGWENAESKLLGA